VLIAGSFLAMSPEFRINGTLTTISETSEEAEMAGT